MNTTMKQAAPNDTKYVERNLEENNDQQHGKEDEEEEEQKRTSKLGSGIIGRYPVSSLLFAAAFVAIIFATIFLAYDFKNWSDGSGSDNDTAATQTTATTLPIVIPLNRCYHTHWLPPGYPILNTYSLGAPFNDQSFVDGEYINGKYVLLEDKRDGYYTFEIGLDGNITGFVRTNDDTGSIVEVFNEVEFIAISKEVLLFNGDPTTGDLDGGYGTIIKGSDVSAGPTGGTYQTKSVEDSSNDISPEEWLLKNFHKDLPLSADASGDESKDESDRSGTDNDKVATQTMVSSSTITKRYKSEEGDDIIWYQLTSKLATVTVPAPAPAMDNSKNYYTQLCQEEFGSGSSIVDWSNDLKLLHEKNEIGNLLTALGIDDPTFNDSYFFVTENRADFYGDYRKYFFENHGGNPPDNWLVHDQLGDISLGSWYDIEGKVLCKYCDGNAAPCYN